MQDEEGKIQFVADSALIEPWLPKVIRQGDLDSRMCSWFVSYISHSSVAVNAAHTCRINHFKVDQPRALCVGVKIFS